MCLLLLFIVYLSCLAVTVISCVYDLLFWVCYLPLCGVCWLWYLVTCLIAVFGLVVLLFGCCYDFWWFGFMVVSLDVVVVYCWLFLVVVGWVLWLVLVVGFDFVVWTCCVLWLGMGLFGLLYLLLIVLF